MLKKLFFFVFVSLSQIATAHASALIQKDAHGKIHVKMNLIFFTLEKLTVPDHLQSDVIEQIKTEWQPAFLRNEMQLDLTSEALSYDDAYARGEHSISNADNFMVWSENRFFGSSFVMGAVSGGNLAFFRPQDLTAVPKRFAHEFGHLLGLEHPEDAEVKTSGFYSQAIIHGAPSIMATQNSLVDDPKYGGEKFVHPVSGKIYYQIRPEFRAVKDENIAKILSLIQWKNERVGTLGFKTKKLTSMSELQYPEIYSWLESFVEYQGVGN